MILETMQKLVVLLLCFGSPLMARLSTQPRASTSPFSVVILAVSTSSFKLMVCVHLFYLPCNEPILPFRFRLLFAINAVTLIRGIFLFLLALVFQGRTRSVEALPNCNTLEQLLNHIFLNLTIGATFEACQRE